MRRHGLQSPLWRTNKKKMDVIWFYLPCTDSSLCNPCRLITKNGFNVIYFFGHFILSFNFSRNSLYGYILPAVSFLPPNSLYASLCKNPKNRIALCHWFWDFLRLNLFWKESQMNILSHICFLEYVSNITYQCEPFIRKKWIFAISFMEKFCRNGVLIH